jgi:hypothetical protein
VSDRGPLAGLAALLAILGVATIVGAAAGVGPLASTTLPDRVTDPEEMVARSLQSTLDASAVHLDATLSGRIPGALIGRDAAAVVLDGTKLVGDLRPRDARSQATLVSPPLDLDLATVTVWGDAWFRHGPDQPWTKTSLGSVGAAAGIDINPLTLVDRLRSYLAGSPRSPTATDVRCTSQSGTCHRVVLDLGTDATAMLRTALPGARTAVLPDISTTMTLDTDAKTLRPAHLALHMTSADGTLDLRLSVDASNWEEPIRIEAPPDGS